MFRLPVKEFGLLDGMMWLLLTLGPLLFLQRKLHYEIQVIFYLFTRRKEIAIILFSIVFFPGVALHELSHWTMAKLVRVRTGRFSLLPKVESDGKLRLGFVTTEKCDPVRDLLIGLAPLIFGSLFIVFIGNWRLNLTQFWIFIQAGELKSAVSILPAIYQQPDFWLWFYLVFTVSSMMFPSASDRRSWLTIGLWLGLIVLVVLITGFWRSISAYSEPIFNQLLSELIFIFGISALAHVILYIPLGFSRWLICHLLRLEIG